MRTVGPEGLTIMKKDGDGKVNRESGKSLFLLTVYPLVTAGLVVGLNRSVIQISVVIIFFLLWGFPWWLRGKESPGWRSAQSWVGKIPGRKVMATQCVPGESMREAVGLQSMSHKEEDTIEWWSLSLSFHHTVQIEPTSVFGVQVTFVMVSLSGALSASSPSAIPLARWRQQWWDALASPRSIVEGSHETWCCVWMVA